MTQALKAAQKSLEAGEVPIGAVVVTPTGGILGAGYNKVEKLYCQTEHAEVRAIKQACKKIQDWRLSGCTLYVTLEPCMMCVSLIALSRIERIVYGATSPFFGYHLDREGILALYTTEIKNIVSGVMEDEAKELLQIFFQKKRKQNDDVKYTKGAKKAP